MTETVDSTRLREHIEVGRNAWEAMRSLTADETFDVVTELLAHRELLALRQSDTRIEGGGKIKAGDTVRILRARNASGEDVYALTDKPYQPGETFVVGEIQDEGTGYPCRVVFPVGEHADFWREDDLALEPPPPVNKSPTPEHVEGDVLSVGEMEVVAYHVRRLTGEGKNFSASLRFDEEQASETNIVTPLVTLTSATTRIQRAERERDEAVEAENEAKDCFWAVYPTYCKTVGHGVSTEAARSMLSTRATTAEAQLADAVKVLEPFAAYAWGLRGRRDGEHELGWMGSDEKGKPAEVNLKVGTFRAARAFLSTIGEKPE